MTKHWKKAIALALAIVLLCGVFAGCNAGPDEPSPSFEVTDNANKPVSNAADSVFSLNCNRSFSFNPMTTTNENNLIVTQLMYDTVFKVDAEFAVSSDIIAEFSSENGQNWTLTVDDTVEFWDGSALTAADVVYSLQRAQQSSIYKSRVRTIVGLTAMDATKVAVTLSGPNMQLPALLTIPVIKYGSVEEAVPMGTGAYSMDEGATRLSLNKLHKNAAIMPIDIVYLKEILEVEQLISSFENSEIDLVTNDPTALTNLGYGSANEIRGYPTTNMHYLGFNCSKGFFTNPLCRWAMTYVVNRENIVTDILKGNANEAALPMNPACTLYNSNYSEIVSYSVKKSEEAFDAAEVSDFDDDGLREIMVTGIPMEINLNFIVSASSPQKVQAAKAIAANLTELGITVSVRELSWDDYNAALVNGDFDLYYAETMLTADFNPTQLVLSNQPLNFGKYSDSGMAEHVANYLSANEEGRKTATDLMFKYIIETAPIVAICFEKHQVITHRGVISGMRPTQFSVFQNIEEWEVDLG